VMRVLARSGDQFLPTVVLSVEYEGEGLRVVQVGLGAVCYVEVTGILCIHYEWL